MTRRSRAERERDREDLLLAIDELDLRAMTRAGVVAQAYTDTHGWLWVRADSLDADRQSDIDDLIRQQWSWEEIS